MNKIAACLLLLSAAAPALAAPVKQKYQFSLSGFSDPDSPKLASPATTIAGSFTISYDPTLVYTNETTGLSDVTLTGFSPVMPFGYTTDPVRRLLLVGSTGGPFGVAAIDQQNDFLLSIDLTGAVPALVTCAFPLVSCGSATGNAAYLISGYAPQGGVFLAATAASTLSETDAGAVPEPATWGTMLLGFGALGLALRRRRIAVFA